jgi:Fe-coproporphyrin III synthase
VPLVTLHLTERCNSRCVTCDYWRHGRDDLSAASVARLLPSLQRLDTRAVLISGGEPLIHPQWQEIAQLLRDAGLDLWLLTSGLSLVKYAARVAALFQSVTVSLDGTDREMYAAIRGLDAFDNVCNGIRALADAGGNASVRVTLQRTNYESLPRFIELAHEIGAQQISFLAVDVGNAHAFGRADDFRADVGLSAADLARFERVLSDVERRYADDFRSGFIAESPAKLRRLLSYFSALCGQGDLPPVRCNVAEFSAVIGVHGQVSPCFFIPGPPGATVGDDLDAALNSDAMASLRRAIRERRRAECSACVCSLWREPDDVTDFTLAHARRLNG